MSRLCKVLWRGDILLKKYEEQVPTEYFLRVLGRHLKYSCCLYGKPGTSLDDAEEAMLGVGWLLDDLACPFLLES